MVTSKLNQVKVKLTTISIPNKETTLVQLCWRQNQEFNSLESKDRKILMSLLIKRKKCSSLNFLTILLKKRLKTWIWKKIGKHMPWKTRAPSWKRIALNWFSLLKVITWQLLIELKSQNWPFKRERTQRPKLKSMSPTYRRSRVKSTRILINSRLWRTIRTSYLESLKKKTQSG